MNIYDLPIPNFGELEDEAALRLILEVRSRRRITKVTPAKANKISPSKPAGPKVKVFNTPFGKFTAEQMRDLVAKLKE